MKKFSFKLETLLKVRKQKEDGVLRLLAEHRRQHVDEIAVKERLLDDLQNSFRRREEISEDIRHAVNVQQLCLEDLFIIGTKQRLSRQDLMILRAKKKVDRTSASYFKARSDRKIMDRLKEKDSEKFKDEQSRLEAIRDDDLNIMRARFRKEHL